MSDADITSVHDVFTHHLVERPFWEQVAAAMKSELERVVQHLRIPGKVEARAKSTGSVIGKAYRKPATYSTLGHFGDLAAARVLVPFASDVEPVVHEIRSKAGITVLDDDAKPVKVNELAYQARHLDLGLDIDAFNLITPAGFGDRVVRCEVQVQTFAQGLWANMSHVVSYKRDLPEHVQRRMNRLIVLCELFDDEAEHSRALAVGGLDAVAAIAGDLQRYFFSITGATHDPDQSLAILNRLLDTLDEPAAYQAVLESFVHIYADRLHLLLADRPEARGIHWMLRPEILLIFERITNAPSRFAAIWDNEFDPADRIALTSAWGPHS